MLLRDYTALTWRKIGKDILTRCPVVGAAAARAADASADDVLDNALRDPARDVTPSGTPHCNNACSNARAAPRTTRNSPAEHNAATRNLGRQPLGAGLRATPTRQLTPQLRMKLLTPLLPALLLVLMRLLVILPLPEVTALALAVLSTLRPTTAHAGVPDAAALVPDASPALAH